jgi:type II secretory pathway pseudopilin PulG
MSDERGETLIEILATVVSLGIAFVAILGSMGTSTAASGTHKRQAEANALLVSAADRLKSQQETPYVSCADPAVPATIDEYLTSIRSVSLPSGAIVPAISLTIPIGAVGYWNGTDFATTNTCQDNTTPRLREQQITIQVSSGNVTESLTIVKRDTP